ncbi:hypothetical protein [Streptomyces geranii]|uniref:hypothetical protein n=1 Tax=Streptomyces geranii TaxID=2058923 RepID=UPI000D025D8F|nr:hypothetical protein [Streptomyces geranii]
MTDNSEGDVPETAVGEDAVPASSGMGPPGCVQTGPESGPSVPVGGGQNEVAGLVLLINTVLGGLGTLYVTTKSVEITLCSALLVLVITLVVLVVRRVTGPGGRPEREGQGAR